MARATPAPQPPGVRSATFWPDGWEDWLQRTGPKNRSTREAGCDLYWRVTLEKAMAIIGELRDTVALQAAHIEALTGQNAELQRQNTELQRQNAELTQRVTQLEERLNQNSGNSDKPPSSDSVFRSPKTEANRRKPRPRPPTLAGSFMGETKWTGLSPF